MSKRFYQSKLGIQLIFCLVLSVLVSVGVFFLLLTWGENIIDSHLNKISYVKYQRDDAIEEFQAYITENQVSINDSDKISEWVRAEKYVTIDLYRNNVLVYSSDNIDFVRENDDLLRTPTPEEKSLLDVQFADANVKMNMNCYFEYKYYYIISIICILIAFSCFISIILFFINQKTVYIERLEDEIKILEGGDLAYPITVKGNDEITYLAQSINEMRKSFIERLENEDKARAANSELVTAMSHDLRTPLTALIGYLDIIEFQKYKSEESLTQYINNSREKAYQIKQLSDKLFEYFTVFNTDEQELEYEIFDGNQLLDQLISDQLMILEDRGYAFELEPGSTPFELELNLISIRRVFDNLFSNIIKYADEKEPIRIRYFVDGPEMVLQLENAIKSEGNKVDSSGIGLKSCEKIIKDHGGSLSVEKNERKYSIEVRLSIKK